MDIAKPKSPNRWKYTVITAALLVVVALCIGLVFSPHSDYKVERSKLLLGTVQRGELQVTVDGYGILRSEKQTLITALSQATVKEVVLRPGTAVDEASVILRLNNPDLLREMETADIALAQEQANLRRLNLTNQRDLLTEQATLVELNSNLQAITLRRDAEQGLAGGAISQLAYKTTVLQQSQLQERVNLQKERIEQLKKVAQEAVLIQKKQISQAEAQYQNTQQRVERLTVKAGMKGVLQRLPVELGQSVNAGQELALVGSDKDLKALIRVSQAKAEQLQVGQLAQINTRRETVPGKVTRITPEVQEGTIEVELAFSEGVPGSARPELSVDARIFTATIKNTLFIERPLNTQSHTKGVLYRLQSDNKVAEVQSVAFGEESDEFIQIESGANEKDQFILSDMNSFRDAKKIQLIN